MASDDQTKISLPRSLVVRLDERVEGTEFTSTSAYVTYVMEEVISHAEGNKPTPEAVEDEAVWTQLRALGYRSGSLDDGEESS